jgi:hypothetical protein
MSQMKLLDQMLQEEFEYIEERANALEAFQYCLKSGRMGHLTKRERSVFVRWSEGEPNG